MLKEATRPAVNFMPLHLWLCCCAVVNYLLTAVKTSEIH